MNKSLLILSILLFSTAAFCGWPCYTQDEDPQIVQNEFQAQLTGKITEALVSIYEYEEISILPKDITIKYSTSKGLPNSSVGLNYLFHIDSISVAAQSDSQDFEIVLSETVDFCSNRYISTPCVALVIRSSYEEVFDSIGQHTGWNCKTQLGLDAATFNRYDLSFELKNKATQRIVTSYLSPLTLPTPITNSVFRPRF